MGVRFQLRSNQAKRCCSSTAANLHAMFALRLRTLLIPIRSYRDNRGLGRERLGCNREGTDGHLFDC